MPEELTFRDEAAAEYDRAFAHVTAYFMPFLLRAAHLAPGMRILDIATGTGLSAEAALAAVGPAGHVAAADISPASGGLYYSGKVWNCLDFMSPGLVSSIFDLLV
jgi:predicted O-methyltransferase YrrM